MKLENFEAAVHLYGKAIELNPANAVYFCNRYLSGREGCSGTDRVVTFGGVGCVRGTVALSEERGQGVASF